MGNFTIGAAWGEAMAFLQRHMTMLLVLIGGSILLAALIQTFVFGISQAEVQAQMQSALASGQMEAFMTTFLPGIAGAGLIGAIIQATGQFAAYRMGLSGEEDYASAIIYGLTAAITSLIFWSVVMLIVALVLGLTLGALGMGFAQGSGGGSAAMLGIFGLLILLLLPVALWLAARLWAIQPAMADARSINPLYGLSQSWRLTAPYQWPLLGYLLLIIIGMIVVFGILGAIAGFIGAAIGETIGELFVALVIGVPIGMLGLAIGAGIYRTLAPHNTSDVFS